MTRRLLVLTLLSVALFLTNAGVRVKASNSVTITPLTTGLTWAVGIDWLPDGIFGDDLLISRNYPTGVPENFAHIDRTTGVATNWGPQSGWNDEIYFSTVRPGQVGCWPAGTMYTGAGSNDFDHASHIAQFLSDGTLVNAHFANLPGEWKLKRGGVKFDYAGVAGGDLIVIASNYPNATAPTGPSDVYRIDCTGQTTHLATLDVHLEGITTIPNDSAKYGPWAGQILAGAERDKQLWTIDPVSGATHAYGEAELGFADVEIEDMWVVPANSTFYGVETGEVSAIWKIDAPQWTNHIGKVLLAQEDHAQLYTVSWQPGAPGHFVTEMINDGTDGPGNWEHITFAPAPASLSGYVYLDANNDGIKQGTEAPIPGVTVSLTGTDVNGAPVSLTTVTDGTGLWSFPHLVAGTYTVTETQPAGYLDGKDTQGTPGTGTTGNDVFSNIVLAGGVDGADNNFGELQPASLGDSVWNDTNGNGIQDGGEAGVPNVTVQLYDAAGTTLLATTTTDANGKYLFANLVPGTYTVKFVLPSGSTFTAKDQGANDATDSDANTTTGFTGQYTLGSGQTNLTVDAGLTPQGKSFTIAGSMEGNLSNIRPGDWVNGGYSFKFANGTHAATTFLISGTVSIPVQCSKGGGPGGTIVVPLNQLPFGSSVPSIAPVTGTPGPASIAWGVPANNANWLASGDQNNVWTWTGAVQAPDLCGGNPMDDTGQAVFNATVSQSAPTGSLVDFRFHYRDPAAKGKPNTNCLNTSDPNRAKADVCGASWSGTRRDP